MTLFHWTSMTNRYRLYRAFESLRIVLNKVQGKKSPFLLLFWRFFYVWRPSYNVKICNVRLICPLKTQRIMWTPAWGGQAVGPEAKCVCSLRQTIFVRSLWNLVTCLKAQYLTHDRLIGKLSQALLNYCPWICQIAKLVMSVH